MAGWNEKLRRDAGLKKPMLDPLLCRVRLNFFFPEQ